MARVTNNNCAREIAADTVREDCEMRARVAWIFGAAPLVVFVVLLLWAVQTAWLTVVPGSDPVRFSRMLEIIVRAMFITLAAGIIFVWRAIGRDR